MFADSLLDSAWPGRYRRGWSTLASFAVQAAAVGGLLLLPLIYTSSLPQLTWISPLLVMPSSAPPSASHARAARPAGNHEQTLRSLTAPQTIPDTIESGNEVAVPVAPDFNDVGIPSGSNDRASGNGIKHGFGNGFDVAAPPPPPPAPHALRVSRMMEGNLIYRVQPEYPSLARLARIQGAVMLRAVISKQGRIENLQAVSGPPMLIKAAMDAVQQWRYRPYLSEWRSRGGRDANYRELRASVEDSHVGRGSPAVTGAASAPGYNRRKWLLQLKSLSGWRRVPLGPKFRSPISGTILAWCSGTSAPAWMSAPW